MNGTFILIIFYKEIIFPLGRSFFPVDKVSYWSGRALQIICIITSEKTSAEKNRLYAQKAT